MKKGVKRERRGNKLIRLGRVNIHLTNRWLYTLIVIGVLVIATVGVYAWANPATGVGHDLSEIQPCAAGKILQTNTGGNGWDCVDMPSATPTTQIDGIYHYRVLNLDISMTCDNLCVQNDPLGEQSGQCIAAWYYVKAGWGGIQGRSYPLGCDAFNYHSDQIQICSCQSAQFP